MQIRPEEIATVEQAGELDGAPVKLCRLIGGLWIAVGKPKGRQQEQALGMGSHPAIVRYNVERQYPDFRPAMMKSVFAADESLVLTHSRFLSEKMRRAAHEIYSIQTGADVEFQVTHQNMQVAGVKALMKGENLEVSSLDFNCEHLECLAGAVAEKAMFLGVGFRLK